MGRLWRVYIRMAREPVRHLLPNGLRLPSHELRGDIPVSAAHDSRLILLEGQRYLPEVLSGGRFCKRAVRRTDDESRRLELKVRRSAKYRVENETITRRFT